MPGCRRKRNTRPFVLVEGLPTDETQATAGTHGRVEIGECSGWVLEKHDAELGEQQIKMRGFEAIRLSIRLKEREVVEAAFPLTFVCAGKHRRGNIDPEDC